MTVLTAYNETKEKNLVSNQYTLFDSSGCSHSDWGSSTVKTMPQANIQFAERKIVAHIRIKPGTLGSTI